MIDPKILKDNPQLIKDMLKRRKVEYPFSELLHIDKKRRGLILEIQNLRHRKNTLSQSISNKKKNQESADKELGEMKNVGELMQSLAGEKSSVEKRYCELIYSVPNILHESVPIGDGEEDNIVIRMHDDYIKSSSRIDHVDLANSLGLIDLERAAKIAGSRFYFLKNTLVKMNQALINYGLDFLFEHGYQLIQPPFMLKNEAIKGSIIMDDFEDVIYKIENEDLYMIGTSEHAMASMHMDEILDSRKLPLRYASISPCFRKEAGAHGKDMKGIFRVHQFEKVEQFVISDSLNSFDEQERMLNITERFYQNLEIPFRVVLLCSADTGKVSSKTYDIEAWMPGQNKYREIGSCSNCIDFQSRRLSIRHREKVNEGTQLVHTLNSTLVATERTMAAILENYQTNNKTVVVPSVLRKYMGDIQEIKIG
ncbi:MAG TPA: serine--tRNA ligase [Nitrososphaeraceae archaeon]|jgi:seryl-tRNA synthetase|nr:serine--tRNA ligase [Nitrososphaeraceae archaeon]